MERHHLAKYVRDLKLKQNVTPTWNSTFSNINKFMSPSEIKNSAIPKPKCAT